MPNGTIDDASAGIAVEPVRDVRLEIRLPTPPILEIAFYMSALLMGIGFGAVVSLVAHVAA